MRNHLVSFGIGLVWALACPAELIAEEVPVYYDYLDNGQLRGGKVLVDRARLRPSQFAGDHGPGSALGGWPSTTIVNNGPSANRVDLVFIGDGYTTAQQINYNAHVNTVRTGFFAQEPLNVYATYFNVHRVNVESPQSGVDEIDLGIFVNTALDMAYGCFGIDRLLCIDVFKAETAAAAAPQAEQILALANSTRYGGAGYPSDNLGTLAGNNGSAIEIALHEFGHAFADLADEYDYGGPVVYTGPEPTVPNVSIYTAAQQVAQQRKWWRWMDLGNVDAFEGANYSEQDIYRPTFDSKMRSLGRPFEQVNVEQFVISLYEIVNPIDDATPPSGTPLSACTTFFVDPLDPVGYSLDVQWSVDGANVPGAATPMFTPAAGSLTPGLHTVSVRVVDPTPRVRDENLRNLLMTETRSWTISVSGPYGDVNNSGLINIDDVLCVLAAFANPAACPDADLHPCAGNAAITLDDILAMLRAFSGNPDCTTPC